MATLEEMSPPSALNYTDSKGSKGFSPTCCNSSSDELLWNKLRSRTDHFVEKRKNEGLKRRSFPDEDPLLSEQKGTEEAERSRKRMKEGDSFLLLKGLDSIASSLSQLTNCLDSALQGATDLSKPRLAEVFCSRDPATTEQEEGHPRQPPKEDGTSDRDPLSVNKSGSAAPPQSKEEERGKLKNAQNLACAMATKAASLARELQSIKSDLLFMQERCNLLEEENRRLRDGIAKGLRPEEDDLVRLQLEALLAEKSRLANENANLTRENQCLHQLVEYHQLTMQDLSASPDQTIVEGVRLDFSSLPEAEEEEGPPRTPRTDNIGFLYCDGPRE
ncbi:uncharacterized protein LOC116260992 isoform X2 [Nymphaea colorata]|uniref:uncharacterized protein LOC116260992 isoform X2 n=1 Tax=Nymphaea colorata TaxID=210225 RepID=UPI00129EF498|nr:uncharacterized protein LOC116260992 isoform X2 [Nymphaea colorata]